MCAPNQLWRVLSLLFAAYYSFHVSVRGPAVFAGEICVCWFTFNLWWYVGTHFSVFKWRVLDADENMRGTVAKLCINVLAEPVSSLPPPPLTHKWGPVETMLSFNFKSTTALIKHCKTNCHHLYVPVCVFTHPARQQVCTCACLIYGLMLRIGGFNTGVLHRFWWCRNILWATQTTVSLTPLCLLLIPPFFGNNICIDVPSLCFLTETATFVILALIITMMLIHCHQRNLCLFTILLRVTRVSGFSVFLMAYKAPLCAHSIPVEPPLILETTMSA